MHGISTRSGGHRDRRARATSPEPAYWDEADRRARYDAVSDACWIYRYRDLEHNLRRFSWRQARRKVLARGALSGQWASRGHGDLRLTRGGLEMRFKSGVRTVDWKKLKEMIEARRS
ncbi:Hypothetical Protein RradSPS_2903 (plasmid) [Rubrobacter radiotolerans]|uniref:Uncharacterized protein n=1 Tax=Rubrobacter radiotolerans TaxID=42256 RepID=A0A023X7K2_RUBRA|nr:hypothetical protein [Rubrobacter radiotolerans]AHY48186.1 Hypothetical Protein RradSPS_2903 [Rubrobacter radiotolerans]MDX5895445.1 hypothetical protein [Rubrobacter radiotolerans]SMC01832.1 hypothetical protein SAMN00767673_3000 [Rubrobacter radiotolerans DSM 5868]